MDLVKNIERELMDEVKIGKGGRLNYPPFLFFAHIIMI
jgi:hypothetical protein